MLTTQLLPGERDWLNAVAADPADHTRHLVYADWLDEHGDAGRAAFLRQFVVAAKTMAADDFPKPKKLPPEWLDLIGFSLLDKLAREEVRTLKKAVLKFARPALRLPTPDAAKTVADAKLPVGASKVGGWPDLPAGFRWPTGHDCHATYNSPTKGERRLAGFLAQVNLAEIAATVAARELPKTGLLSFFGFMDIENDNPDVVGVTAVHVDGELARTAPPGKFSEGNTAIKPYRLTFTETLDLPVSSDGPWAGVWPADVDVGELLNGVREANFTNLLGYARGTSGGDPTPTRQSRHLILLTNAVGCRLHVQIPQRSLAAGKFDKITLRWVDFD